ncbi:MAG: branched-chain amino acid ABC transporter substrate-binding protein [Rhodocyclaceae bacterium]|nr:branched-chain amino acid ABC transporter substrate-binding protein [Rhodocyclaceae bacterium]
MNLPIRSLTLAVAAALALSACGKKEDAQTGSAGAVVKIGQASPLTGPQAHLGKDNENGVRLALEEANAKGVEVGGAKVKFELVSEDDQADPKQGTLVAQKLVDGKVAGVLGHLNSGTTIPASRIYSEAGLPQVSPSATNPKYTQQGFKTAFRVMANDVQQGKVLGSYAVNKLNAKAIAIIDDRSAYGQGLADEFQKAVEAAGGRIVAREFTNDKATDFTAILTKVKSKSPDLVFYGGMDSQAGPMARQIKALGVKAPMLFGDGGCTTEFSKLAGDAAEGNYCSLPGVPLEKMSGGTEFKARFKARFNVDIQLYAPYAYDAANVMIDAMKRANSTDPKRYLPLLGKTDFPGVTGRIVFDDKGDLMNGAITLYQSRGGQWQPLETVGGGDISPAAVAASLDKAADGGAKPVGAQGIAMENVKAVEQGTKGPGY